VKILQQDGHRRCERRELLIERRRVEQLFRTLVRAHRPLPRKTLRPSEPRRARPDHRRAHRQGQRPEPGRAIAGADDVDVRKPCPGSWEAVQAELVLARTRGALPTKRHHREGRDRPHLETPWAREPSSVPMHFQRLVDARDTSPHSQAGRGPTAWGVRAPDDQHVAATLDGHEVGRRVNARGAHLVRDLAVHADRLRSSDRDVAVTKVERDLHADREPAPSTRVTPGHRPGSKRRSVALEGTAEDGHRRSCPLSSWAPSTRHSAKHSLCHLAGAARAPEAPRPPRWTSRPSTQAGIDPCRPRYGLVPVTEPSIPAVVLLSRATLRQRASRVRGTRLA
jgi:hypothetical protein